MKDIDSERDSIKRGKLSFRFDNLSGGSLCLGAEKRETNLLLYEDEVTPHP